MKVLAEGVKFGYSAESKVLDRATWVVNSGVTGLIGENGAGKTTLLSIIATLKRPQRGRLLIGGHDAARPSGRRAARRLIGFVPQSYTLAGELTVTDTVAYAAWVSGVGRTTCGAAAERAMRLVGLPGRERRRVRALRADERRLVGIAAALAHDPEILVMDAPADGLDEAQRARLRVIVTRLARDRTIILSSCAAADIADMCDEAAVLAGGRIVYRGSPAAAGALVENGVLSQGSRVGIFEPRVGNGGLRRDTRQPQGGP
ncbi:ATP-binding cassette domain-containing protein [Nocardiopsis rhodophaea]|uniref:ATP-binding cassette domain-containing protein n=1 Tax=Nocardiopsis rhodophaea TaxID=280238 RepID=UPI0031D3BD52